MRDRYTIQNYLLPAIGGVQMGAVTSLHIRRLIDPLAGRLAPSTIRGIYGTIAHTFKSAVEADVIGVSPVRGVRRPVEHPTRKRFLDVEEVGRLADAFPDDLRVFVYLGAVSGLRFSEIAGLRVGSIDFLRRTVAVTETVAEVAGVLMGADVKTPASRRTLPLPTFLVEELSAHVGTLKSSGRDDYLLPSPGGGPLRYSNFHRRVWAPAVKEAGLDGLTIHGLRHSSAGLMIEAGAHPRVIQQRMGHSSITTTMNTYGSVLPSVDDGVTRAVDGLFRAQSGADVVQKDVG